MADRFTPTRRKAERRGRRSESWAALLLLLKGYRILGRRVKTPLGEIDLVARSPRGILCFIEVKQRETGMAAHESVAPRQQARIARAAALYLASIPAWMSKACDSTSSPLRRRLCRATSAMRGSRKANRAISRQ